MLQLNILKNFFLSITGWR